MDDVPIPLRPAFDSPFPGDEEILTAIKNRVVELTKDKRGVSDTREKRQVA